MVSPITVTIALNPNQEMTDFDYKKYSLENLENWMHDAMSAGEATPQEIYDVIVGVVKETYYHHKDQVSRANELLGLLNSGVDNNKYQNHLNEILSCDKDDPSPECQGAWNDFWENEYPKVDGYSVDGVSHSQYWYEYDRNDPNRKNPFSSVELPPNQSYIGWQTMSDDKFNQEFPPRKDKVVKWQLPVGVDGLTGDYYIELPDDLLEAANLKEGDQVQWIDRGDGSFEMRKVNA